METKSPEKRLGKGLEALISNEPSKGRERIEKVDIKKVRPNPFQPRKRFSAGKMEELIRSLAEKGIIQPILVRPAGEEFEIIAGERRWRAAKESGHEEIPIIVKKDIDDANALELSLIENIQREELNPVEEATAYRELIDKFGYDLDKVGHMMGKDKTTISNSLRLLSLSEEIRSFLEEGKITTGHAKAILGIENERRRKKIADRIIKQGLSVRETENLVRRTGVSLSKKEKKHDPETESVEERLRHKLGTRVVIRQGKKRGRIEIQYFSNEDLDRIIRVLLGEGEGTEEA